MGFKGDWYALSHQVLFPLRVTNRQKYIGHSSRGGKEKLFWGIFGNVFWFERKHTQEVLGSSPGSYCVWMGKTELMPGTL